VALEIRTEPDALLGTPPATGLRGAGPDPGDVLWRARTRDDDGRVWQAQATSAPELGSTWTPAKASTGAAANRRSLHPFEIEVRAELGDGRGASRSVTRRLLAEGVKVRRWRGEHATLYLPPSPVERTLLVDATASDPAWLGPAASVLASQGALVLTAAAGADLELLAERITAVRGARPAEWIAPPPAPPGFPASSLLS